MTQRFPPILLHCRIGSCLGPLQHLPLLLGSYYGRLGVESAGITKPSPKPLKRQEEENQLTQLTSVPQSIQGQDINSSLR